VEFHSHDGGVWILRDKVPDIRVHGPIIIEYNCIIGVNTILQPNIRIGRNSIIGANSVVISDIPPNSIAMGIPARICSSISKYEEKCITKWNEQKPPDLNTEKGNEWWRFEENRQKLRVHLTSLSKDDINAGERLIDKQARAEN
jgi:tetrahydrodipicolinate N-succinyltransferase